MQVQVYWGLQEQVPHVCDYTGPDGTTSGACYLPGLHGGRFANGMTREDLVDVAVEARERQRLEEEAHVRGVQIIRTQEDATEWSMAQSNRIIAEVLSQIPEAIVSRRHVEEEALARIQAMEQGPQSATLRQVQEQWQDRVAALLPTADTSTYRAGDHNFLPQYWGSHKAWTNAAGQQECRVCEVHWPCHTILTYRAGFLDGWSVGDADSVGKTS